MFELAQDEDSHEVDFLSARLRTPFAFCWKIVVCPQPAVQTNMVDEQPHFIGGNHDV